MAGKTQGWKLHKNPRTGIYQVRFRVGGKRYHRSTGKTDRAAAQSTAARLVRRVIEGDRLDHGAPDVPLPELIGSWLAGVRATVSPQTLRTWELYAGAHFIPHFESTERLCSERCLRDYMRNAAQEVKARTVQKELSALRRLLAWMVERGLVQEAPAVPKLPRRATGTAHPSGRRKRIDLSPRRWMQSYSRFQRGRETGNHFGHTSRSCEKPGFAQGPCSASALRTTIDPGSRFLRIRAEADRARYAREVPLTVRAREVLDEMCPAEGTIFPKFAWRYPLRTAALAAGLEPDRASQVKPYDFRHSVATELTERSGNLLGVGYLLGHRHATTTNQYVHARRRAAESVLLGQNLGQIESGFEVPVIGDRANPPTSLQCEEQDSNLHALRTLEPKRTQGMLLSSNSLGKDASADVPRGREKTHSGQDVPVASDVVTMSEVRACARALVQRVAKGGEIPLASLRELGDLVLRSELVAVSQQLLDGPPEFALRRAMELSGLILASVATDEREADEEAVK